VSLSDSELDRLADYTVDVLEPHDAAEVERLVRTDPQWAAAYRDLVDADAAVRADLSAVAATGPMPADVVARIDDALADLGRGPGRAATVTPIGSARSRRRRAYTGLGVAAATIVAVGGGFIALRPGIVTDNAFTASRGGQADNAVAPAAQPELAPPVAGSAVSGVPTLSTGTDYQPGTLGQFARRSLAAPAPQDALKSGQVPADVAEAAPGPLARLTGSDALASCLGAVLTQHPGTVAALDYARYRGEPALVIAVRQVGGVVVVAVGGACGLAGPDERAVVPGG
jgi:hypothetical protein